MSDEDPTPYHTFSIEEFPFYPSVAQNVILQYNFLQGVVGIILVYETYRPKNTFKTYHITTNVATSKQQNNLPKHGEIKS